MSIFDLPDDYDEELNGIDGDAEEEPEAMTFESVMCRNGHVRTEANTKYEYRWNGTKRLRCTDCERGREQQRRRKPADEPRVDAFPEAVRYRDEGCSLNPSCLSCPFSKCRYDAPDGSRSIRTEAKREQAIILRRQGRKVDEISQELHLSRRSVFRLFAAAVAV